MTAREKKKEIIGGLIDSARKYRFCSPSEDIEEIWGVTTGYRNLIVQLQRMAGPMLPPDVALQLNAINVEINDVNSAFDADSELSALLPDIEAALENSENNAMPPEQPFSKRHQFSSPKEITVREDAPKNLR